MRPKKFLRQDTMRHSRLGKNRKKLQKWRKPRGPHSKMRKHRMSYPAVPGIGYKTPKSDSGKIKGRVPYTVSNMESLKKVPKDAIIIIARRTGARKRAELLAYARQHNLMVRGVKEVAA